MSTADSVAASEKEKCATPKAEAASALHSVHRVREGAQAPTTERERRYW